MKQFIESCMSLAKFFSRMVTNSSWWRSLFGVVSIAVVVGCIQSVPMVTSGQHLTVGLWIPLPDGQTFGLQFLDYLQGSKFVGTSNCVMEVQHKTVSTNEYFAVVKTNERVEDKFKLEKKAQPLALEAMSPQNYIWDDFTLDDEIHTNSVRSVQK